MLSFLNAILNIVQNVTEFRRTSRGKRQISLEIIGEKLWNHLIGKLYLTIGSNAKNFIGSHQRLHKTYFDLPRRTVEIIDSQMQFLNWKKGHRKIDFERQTLCFRSCRSNTLNFFKSCSWFRSYGLVRDQFQTIRRIQTPFNQSFEMPRIWKQMIHFGTALTF